MLNRIFAFGLVGLLTSSFAVESGQCERPEEISFNFRDLEIKMAFAILADFAKYRLVIEPSISGSEAMTFVCRRWDVVARELAARHNLRVEIRDGAMYVSKQ